MLLFRLTLIFRAAFEVDNDDDDEELDGPNTILFRFAFLGAHPNRKNLTAREFNEFGERAVSVMLREFAQLVEGAVEGKLAVQVIEPEILTGEDKKKSIGCY